MRIINYAKFIIGFLIVQSLQLYIYKHMREYMENIYVI